MPLLLVLALLDVICIVHAAKTGRFWPWAYVVLLLPGIGAIAYIGVEVLPAWMGSPEGQRARQRVVNKLDPEKHYRKLADDLAISDTIATRTALAEECLALGKFDEARWHYDSVLGRPLGDEPAYALGKAQAEFGLGQPQEAIATLDQLKARWPHYQSAEGHILYARSLQESGRTDEALAEYRALADYHSGAEARVRWAMLLQKIGRDAEAKTICSGVLTQMRRAPRYVRRAQAEWIAIAERALRA
jgi:hypothetical protein